MNIQEPITPDELFALLTSENDAAADAAAQVIAAVVHVYVEAMAEAVEEDRHHG